MQVPCRGSVERIGESEFGGIPQRAQVGSAPGSWVFPIQKKRDLRSSTNGMLHGPRRHAVRGADTEATRGVRLLGQGSSPSVILPASCSPCQELGKPFSRIGLAPEFIDFHMMSHQQMQVVVPQGMGAGWPWA